MDYSNLFAFLGMLDFIYWSKRCFFLYFGFLLNELVFLQGRGSKLVIMTRMGSAIDKLFRY